jgi:hypothetical protein
MVNSINRLAAKLNSSIEKVQKTWAGALGISPVDIKTTYSAVSNKNPSANKEAFKRKKRKSMI